jgi:hypothetical protein
MQKVDRSRDFDVNANISKATALALTGTFVPDPAFASSAASFHQIPEQRVPSQIGLQRKENV